VRILLIEDDLMIGAALQVALKDAAYSIDWFRDGRELSRIDLSDYLAILLDLGLPHIDGIEILRQIRNSGSKIPILILTARGSVDDRIFGLDAGANDYLPKPFDVNELLARLRVLLRHPDFPVSNDLSHGNIVLSPSTLGVRIGKQSWQLSGREFSLLFALMGRPGAILSRTQLQNRIYSENEEIESNAIDFLIHGIRKKLGSTVIRNIRGVGWCLNTKPIHEDDK